VRGINQTSIYCFYYSVPTYFGIVVILNMVFRKFKQYQKIKLCFQRGKMQVSGYISLCGQKPTQASVRGKTGSCLTQLATKKPDPIRFWSPKLPHSWDSSGPFRLRDTSIPHRRRDGLEMSVANTRFLDCLVPKQFEKFVAINSTLLSTKPFKRTFSTSEFNLYKLL